MLLLFAIVTFSVGSVQLAAGNHISALVLYGFALAALVAREDW